MLFYIHLEFVRCCKVWKLDVQLEPGEKPWEAQHDWSCKSPGWTLRALCFPPNIFIPRNAPVHGAIVCILKARLGVIFFSKSSCLFQPGHCCLTFALFLLFFTVNMLILQTGIFSRMVSLRDLNKVKKDILFKRPIGEGPAIWPLNTDPEVSSYGCQHDFLTCNRPLTRSTKSTVICRRGGEEYSDPLILL